MNPDKEDTPNMAFFLMPGEAISLLHFQLYSVVGNNLTETILYKYGFKCGNITTEKLNIDVRPMAEVPVLLKQIWMELGFGRMTSELVGENKLSVRIINGVEGNSLGFQTTPSCHFTRGYISGMISALIGSSVRSTEDKCITVGDEFCEFIIEKTTL